MRLRLSGLDLLHSGFENASRKCGTNFLWVFHNFRTLCISFLRTSYIAENIKLLSYKSTKSPAGYVKGPPKGAHYQTK